MSSNFSIGGGSAGGISISMFPSGAMLAGQLNLFAGDIRSFGPILKKIRDEVIKPRISDNFAGQTAAGESWTPLAEATPFMPYRAERNAGGNPTLDVTGKLKRVSLQNNIWTFNNQEGTMFVSDLPGAQYGEVQQQGGFNYGLSGELSDIPPRPFIIINEPDLQRAEELFNEWVSTNFAKRVGLAAAGSTVGSLVSRGA